MRHLPVALALFVCLPAAAWAGTPVTVKANCAVGGESFTYTTTASQSTWGSRPDGKPYGSWTFPLELPVCPGNQLVMYRDFTAEEVGRLKDLVARADYRALAKTETPYYRAAWLERNLTPGSEDAVWSLLQATWQADADRPRRARYQAEFVSAVDALPKPGTATTKWLTFQLRAANAERELGRFDAAQARLGRLSFKDAGESRDGMEAFARKLTAVAARGDSTPEPMDMIPPRVQVFACADGKLPSGGSLPKEVCETEPLASEVARVKAARQD